MKKIYFAIALIVLVFFIVRPENQENSEEIIKENAAKPVEILDLSDTAKAEQFLETTGVVKPDAQIEAVSLAQGTVKSINFKIGDEVYANQALAHLYNSASLINLSNAEANYNNTLNNLSSTNNLNDERVKQAQIGVKNSQETIHSAEIALKSAQDNLANAKNLQIKRIEDLKQSAIISFANYLNTINSALKDSNYIIQADASQPQLAGIKETLSVQNSAALTSAKIAYEEADLAKKNLSQINPDKNNIITSLNLLADNLVLVKKAIDNTITVLNNTIPNPNFSADALNAQKSAFTGILNSLISAQTGAKNLVQSLENIDLTNKQELDALENTVNIQKNQLNIAKISYDNALSALEAMHNSGSQQEIGVKTSLDSALGQLNLARSQVGDLSIKAPISGRITQKYIELGTEVSPGTKIAQISQSNLVKIEVDLSSENIYQIKLGQEVAINENLKGQINNINPSADPITKKVRIEIIFDNKNKDLIPETFVRLKIAIKNQSEDSFSFNIPLDALIVTPGESYVFVNQDQIAKKISVKSGAVQDGRVSVSGVLKTGDKLIIKGQRDLQDGDKIKIIQ